MRTISQDFVPIAVEDRFLVISIRKAVSLCPTTMDATKLAKAIRLSRPLFGNLTPVFDLRGIPKIYTDVKDFIRVIIQDANLKSPQALVDARAVPDLDLDGIVGKSRLGVMSAKSTKFRTKIFPMSSLHADLDPDGSDELQIALYYGLAEHFIECGHRIQTLDSWKMAFDSVVNSEAVSELAGRWIPRELEHVIRPGDVAQSIQSLLPDLEKAVLRLIRRTERPFREIEFVRYAASAIYLHAFLKRMHSNSLMVEFVMSVSGKSISCAPYHSSAIHAIDRPLGSDIIIGRPAVIARATRSIFNSELKHFEYLLNDPATRESQLQKFLEAHPNFLRGLNYESVYPQVVLERDGTGSLKPDFILEPFDGGWCDILDIKLPRHPVIVGRKDRGSLAAGIHEVAAQLREYAAFFEDERHRRYAKEKYGIRVYRPRLIAIVGRDMRQMGDAEIRRAMTSYENLQIMTFDQLASHAKNRILA